MFVAGTKSDRLAVVAEACSDAEQLWRRVVGPVEPFLAAVVSQLATQVEAFDAEVAPYARYALTNQGKQLRPTLVALSAGAVGAVSEEVVRVAVIIEMIHLATLVHDDIMDEATLRRNRPTMAADSGNEIAVLLGDCLFAHALKLAAGYPTPEVCRAVSAATQTVCSGEILQTLRQREKVCTRTEYFRIVRMKTAELFGLSCDLGSWLAGAPGAKRAALRQFGLDLGSAYQVFDDCVDLFGSEEAAGKSLGKDLANGKLTLPILVVLERASPAQATELRALINCWEGRHARRVRQLLDDHEALPACRSVIRGFLDSARQELRALDVSPHREALDELAQFLAKQTAELGV